MSLERLRFNNKVILLHCLFSQDDLIFLFAFNKKNRIKVFIDAIFYGDRARVVICTVYILIEKKKNHLYHS